MAASDDLDPGQILDVSHEDHAGVEFLATSFDPGHGGRGPQGARAGVDFAAYDTLRAWAEMLNDTQQTRIQIGNRIKANERRGITTPQLMQAEYEAIQDGEHRQELALRRQYRVTAPAAVREWQKTTPGIGEPLLARLLGHLGHPAIARPHHWEGAGTKRRLIPDRPYLRTVSQLWQYCGHGQPGRAWTGITAEQLAGLGSPICKMLVHLVADAACHHTGDTLWPYRNLYDARRAATAEREHAEPCARCGPKGRPAQPGSPWKPGHQHADAHRVVGKQILADVWKAAQ